jgi:hypothetical protein
MICGSTSLLAGADARRLLNEAFERYPHLYDQVLEEVHARLNSAGYATKLDLAALIAWKHVNNAPWMQEMLKLPPLAVQQYTASAFGPGKTDQERVDAVRGIPGFRAGAAFASVLLAAWRPSEFGVYDNQSSGRGWEQVVKSACNCPRTELVVYFGHLRRIADELGGGWTPRDVDKALYMLGQ